jgi:hypothetical protein
MWKFYGEFLIDFYAGKETRNEVRVRPHKRSGAGLCPHKRSGTELYA